VIENYEKQEWKRKANISLLYLRYFTFTSNADNRRLLRLYTSWASFKRLNLEELINNRKIKVVGYSTEKNWLDQLPNKVWLCVLLVNNKPRRYVDEVITKIIFKDVGFVCTIGNQAELIQDLVDEEISFRESEIEEPYLPNHIIITTWHSDFEKGIWYSLFAADSEEVEIKKVVILDMTDGLEMTRVKACLEKIREEESGKE